MPGYPAALRFSPWRRSLSPYLSFLSPGDNAWQMTAATLVGLMSIPALAVLYGGIVHPKVAVTAMMIGFSSFSPTPFVWVLSAFKHGLRLPSISTSPAPPAP